MAAVIVVGGRGRRRRAGVDRRTDRRRSWRSAFDQPRPSGGVAGRLRRLDLLPGGRRALSAAAQASASVASGSGASTAPIPRQGAMRRDKSALPRIDRDGEARLANVGRTALRSEPAGRQGEGLRGAGRRG